MRKQLLAVVLTLLLTNQLAVAETLGAVTAASTSGARADLKRVQIAGTADGLQVEITSSAPVVPQVSTLPNPPRLVLDLPNTSLGTASRHIAVDRDGIKAVRLGEATGSARVVIDMASTRDYQVSADGNKLIVKFKGSAIAADTVTPVLAPLAPKVKLAAVTSAALVPVSAKVAVAKPASAPTAVAPAPTSAANDFVVVEPTFKAVAAAPASGRANEAAAKFSDAPLTDLTPAPSAAMKPEAPKSDAMKSDTMKSDTMKSDDTQSGAAKPEAAVNLAAE